MKRRNTTGLVGDERTPEFTRRTSAATLWLLTFFIFTSALPWAAQAQPTVATQSASGQSNAVATLNGTVNPNSLDTTAWFEWGPTTNSYTNLTVASSIGSGGSAVAVSNALTGLTPGVVYHGRMVGSNVAGLAYGQDVEFGSPSLTLLGSAATNAFAGGNFTDPGAIAAGALQAIAAGMLHNLALKSDGTVVAWGGNFSGQATVPAGLSNVVAVAAEGEHSLALNNDGTVVAWGNNGYGQATVPSGLSNVVAVAAGMNHSLAVTNDGTVIAWGLNFSGQATVPVGLSNVVAVAGGGFHSLALKNDGTVVVWGSNSENQTNVPAGLSNVVAVAAGNYHSLALRSDGTVAAWGLNIDGQTNVPAGLSNVVAVSAGVYHSLALKDDGTVVAWGWNSHGQAIVPDGLSNVVAVAAGFTHSLALKVDGNMVGWGQNNYGQAYGVSTLNVTTNSTVNLGALGTYTITYSVTNALGGINVLTRIVEVVPPPPTVVTLAASGQSNTVATLNGTVNPNSLETRAWFEWGLVTNSYPNVTASSGVGSGSSAVAVDHALTGLTAGLVYHGRVVGSNSTGIAYGADVAFGSPSMTLLGSATTNVVAGGPFTDPGVTTSGEVQAIASGFRHNLGVKIDGTVVAWGDNDYRQNDLPGGLSGVTAVAAGGNHSLALKSDGTVVGWGANSDGQADVPGGMDVVAIAAGGSHSLAVQSDGSVVAWGLNDDGQADVPGGLSDVVAVAAGGSHSLALKSDGSVVAWGLNDENQADVPGGLSGVVAVAAGANHSLALKGDGTVVAWGGNDYRQTDLPGGLSDVVAVAAGANHSLAVQSDGTVVAWGLNDDGQADVPGGLSDVVAVAGGLNHSLALKNDGTVAAWGLNDHRQTETFATLTVTTNGTVDVNTPGIYTITYSVTNSLGGINVAIRTVVVASPPNDAPSITDSGSIILTEDVAKALTGILFTDADAGSGSLTATFAVGTGSLTATSGGGVTVGGSGGTTLTLDGALADLNSFLAASNVVFRTATNAYTNVFLTVTINDNGNTGAGGALSATNSVVLTVTPVTDYPSIALNSGSAAFIEAANAPPNPVAVDSGLIVSDPDGPSITAALVAISQQFVAGEDFLNFTNSSATMNNISGSYDANGGYIQLTSAGATATLAHWQAALRSIAYANTSETPGTATRTVTFLIYAGPVVSAPVTRTVTVTAVNDPPQLLNLDGDSVTFTENGAAVALDALSDVVVTDADFTSFVGGYLLVGIVTGLVSAEDVLTLATNSAVTLSNGMTNGGLVSVNGTNVATIVSSGASGENLLLHWNSATTTNAVQEILRSLIYTNLSDTPTTSARSVGIQTADGGIGFDSSSVTLNVIATDDLPTVTMSSGTTAFVEGADVASTPVVVDGGIVVADPDDTDFVSATLAITGYVNASQDVLAFENDNATMGDIEGSYLSASNALQLVSFGGSATKAQFQAALRSVTYLNLSDAPSTNTRTISVYVQSGPQISAPATRAVTIAAANDSPQLTNLDGDAVLFTEAGPGVALDSGGDALVIDPDAEPFALGMLEFGITNNVSTNDTLFLDLSGAVQLPFGLTNEAPVAVSGITIGWLTTTGTNGMHLIIGLNSNATPALVQTLVRAVSFTNSSAAPSTATRDIFARLYDSANASASVGLSVGIADVNNAPTISPPADFGIPENEYFDIPAFTVADEDAGTNDLLVTLELSSGVLFTTVLPFPGVVATGSNRVSRLVGTAAALNDFLAGETNFLALVGDDDTTNVTLTIGVSDGGHSGSGGVKTNHAVVQLTLTTVNDAPTLDGWIGDMPSFVEGGAPVFLDEGLDGAVTDSDSPDFAGGFLMASFFAGGQPAEDVLAFDTNGVVALSGGFTVGSSVSVSNVTVGTLDNTGVGEALRVTFNSNATPTRVQALMRALTYRNVSESPDETARSVRFDLVDGDGGTNYTDMQVGVVAVNDPPSFQLTVGYGQSNSTEVVAWGNGSDGRTNVPPSLGRVVAISGGFDHSLALLADGTVAAWGKNDEGQINVPPGLTNVAAVSAGYFFSAALLSNGTVVAWGRNTFGETDVPTSVTNAIGISAGVQSVLAVRGNGTVLRWASLAYPPSNLSLVDSVDHGIGHAVVRFADGTVQSYGNNTYGQNNVPSGVSNIIAVAAGWFHNVALHSDGRVSAWGRNNNQESTVPADLTNAIAIGAPGYGGLAVRADGSLVTWGDYSAFANPPELDNVLAVSGGGEHALALVTTFLEPITVAEDSGPFSLSGAATNISAGPSVEASQSVAFVVTAADTNMFSVQPAISTNGTLTFTPAPNAYGTTTVSVVAMDTGGTANGGDDTSDTQEFTVRIESVSDAPVAEADAYSVAEDGMLFVAAVSGVLTNDSGGDGNSLTATLVADVSHGALLLYVDGSFSYAPATNYFGTDNFQYWIVNSSGTSSVATVTLTVTPVNDAPLVGVTSVGTTPGVGQGLSGIGLLDDDAGTNHVGVEIVSSAGSLSAISYGGITPATNALNPRVVRLTGSLSNLTAYLDFGGVFFHVPDDVTTNFTYTVTLDDHGHTGADPGTSGTATNEIAASTAPVWVSPILRRVVGPAPGLYGFGTSLDFTLQVSEPVILLNTNAGFPGITLYLLATNRTATYVSGSGTTNLLFRYIVSAGEYSPTVTPEPVLALNGSSIVDLESNAYTGNISGAVLDGVIVDGVPPESVGLSPVAAAWYPLGAVVTLNLLFGESITVNTNGGVPYLALTLQNTNASATYVSGSGSGVLTFQYTVREGDLATNGIILSNNIVLSGATLRDAAGNDAVLSFAPGNLLMPEVRVDGVPPEFVYAIHYSPTPVFNIGSVILFEAYISEPVTVDTNFGSIQIEYQFDFGLAYGDYASNRADGLRLFFVHTVQPGDQATNGFGWSTNLLFNPLAIRDVAGNSARPALPPPYRYENIVVDSLMPAITNAILPPDGIYTSSEPMDFVFEYTEAVTNLGTPRFTLTVNGATRYLSYHSGSGSNALVFRYTPQPGDFATNGIVIVGTLDLNGGAIRDLSGNDAEPVDIAENPFPGLRVDASRPVAGDDDYSLLEDGGTHGFHVLFNDSDADTNTLTFTLVSGATNGTVSPGPNDTFLYTPDADFAGIDRFTYVVSDGLLTSAVATVTIEVLAVNDPPTISGPARITVTNGVARPLVGVSVADIDSGTNIVQLTFLAGDLGSVFLLTNRSGVTVSNGGDGVSFYLRGTVPDLIAYLAATNVFYVADTNRETHSAIAVYIHDEGHVGGDPGLDGDPAGESAFIHILVDNVAFNEAPVVNLALTNQTATYGTAFSFTFPTNAFIDPDGDTLSFSASGLPPGIDFSGATRTFAGTPTAPGNYTVRVIAGDGQTPELTATNSFDIAVAKAALTITAVGQSRACGSPNPVFNLSFDGFRGSDTSAVLDTLPVIHSTANAVSGPGVYSITLTGGSDDDYEFTLVGGTLVVTNGASSSGTLRGTYHGLFYETNEVRHESSGAFLIKATDAGAYSGTLELAGSKLRLAGAFPSGRAVTNVIARRNLSSLTVTLGFDDCDPPQAIFGTVSDGSWTAQLMATPLHFHAKTNPAPTAGRYTMTIPGFENDASLPAGDGWGTITVGTAGQLKLAGALADGTKLTEGSFLNEAGLWPFYLPYARSGGAVLGWITVTNGSGFGGALAWIRKTQPTTAKFYQAGFTNQTEAVGTLYTDPGRGTNVFPWATGSMIAGGGNLSGTLSNQFNLGLANRVTWLGTNFTALTFTPKDGRFKGTLRHNGTGKPATFNGVIHRGLSFGAGFFLGTNQSGGVTVGEP